MTDTHSHLYEPEFADDVHECIARAQQVGVRCIFLPNINAETVEPMLDLCRQYPKYLYPMLGLHPTDVRADYGSVLDQMEQRLQDPQHPYIAIGEVGLDYYWDKTYYSEQQTAFRRQVAWAEKFNLPLMIHSRAAFSELHAVLKDFKGHNLTGVFHCFSSSLQEAQKLLAFEGFMLGIGGVLTYKNAHLPEVLSHIPLSRIVLETDSPYLAPVPYRGKRNESAYVAEVRKTLSYIYKVSEDEVDCQTEANVNRIFTRAK